LGVQGQNKKKEKTQKGWIEEKGIIPSRNVGSVGTKLNLRKEGEKGSMNCSTLEASQKKYWGKGLLLFLRTYWRMGQQREGRQD